MPSLRERKKRKSREQILKAAEEMFMAQGYEKTTIAQIAERANMGIGTFYNYFSSKAEVFLFTFTNNKHLEVAANIDNILDHAGDDPEETLTKLLEQYYKIMQSIDRAFWKEIVLVLYANFEEYQKHFQEHLALKLKALEQITRYFTIYKKRGKLPPAFDPVDGAECLSGILAVQFLMYYLYDSIPDFETLKAKVLRQVKIFILSKFS